MQFINSRTPRAVTRLALATANRTAAEERLAMADALVADMIVERVPVDMLRAMAAQMIEVRALLNEARDIEQQAEMLYTLWAGSN